MSSKIKPHHFNGIDGFRATLMLLGILLHSALNYTIALPHLTWETMSHNRSEAFDVIVFAIHAFRMPAFYLIAGFFACFSVQRHGVGAFVRRRLWRIGLPFFVFSIFPALLELSVCLFSHQPTAWRVFWHSVSTTQVYWFLYYLLIFYAIALVLMGLQRGLPKPMVQAWHGLTKKAFTTLPGLFVVMLLCGLILFCSGHWSEPITESLVPNLTKLVSYGFFFLSGWVIWKNQQVIKQFQTWAFALLTVALIALCAYLQMVLHIHDNEGMRFVATCLYAVVGWTMTLGLFGIFTILIRFPSRVWRYLADASYWCFLIQFPLIIYLQVIMSPVTLSPWAQCGLVFAITLGVCLLSYQLMIRHTRLGSIIDGSKHNNNKSLKEEHAM